MAKKQYSVNLLFRGGPFDKRMATICTTATAGEIVKVNDHDYELLDGPALQAAQKSGKAHPNLAANAVFVAPASTPKGT